MVVSGGPSGWDSAEDLSNPIAVSVGEYDACALYDNGVSYSGQMSMVKPMCRAFLILLRLLPLIPIHAHWTIAE